MLYVHAGASATTLDSIRETYTVPTVEDLREARKSETAGNRWKPLHHADLIDEIHRAAGDRGLSVARESFALSEDTHDVYGFMQFEGFDLGVPGQAPVLGFRSSNLQRFGLLGVSGSRVFICDNGMIVGDFVFGMKHTSGRVGDLDQSIDEGMEKWEEQTANLRRVVESMQSMDIDRRDADHLLLQGVRDKAFSNRQVGRIDRVFTAYQEEEHPHHEAFAERTGWSLYNALTEVAKGFSPRASENVIKRFGRTIARVGGFEDALAAPVDENGIVLN